MDRKDKDAFAESLERIRIEWGERGRSKASAHHIRRMNHSATSGQKVLRSSTIPSEANSVLHVVCDIDIRLHPYSGILWNKGIEKVA